MKSLKLIIISISVLFVTSCSTNSPESYLREIELIKERHIPDARLEYWDIHLAEGEVELILSGATSSKVAYLELEKMAEQNNMDIQVELLPEQEFATDPWALVTVSVCNIRAEGKHSAELVTQALLGTPVKVFKEVDGWFLIQTPDHYFGWVDEAAITRKSNEELEVWKKQEKILYNKASGHGYFSDDWKNPEMDLVMGDLLNIVSSDSKAFKIVLPDGRIAFVKSDECISLNVWKQKQIDIEQLLSIAFVFKGTPYLWGGTSPKMFDCSGFTKTAYYMQGLILQRDASQQTLYGELVDTGNGYNNLLPGDLLFFGRKETSENPEKVTHVGLYMGGMKFIHASGKVRINSLDPNSEDYTEYYEKAFVRARRIIGNVDGKGIEWIVDNEFYRQILSE